MNIHNPQQFKKFVHDWPGVGPYLNLYLYTSYYDFNLYTHNIALSLELITKTFRTNSVSPMVFLRDCSLHSNNKRYNNVPFLYPLSFLPLEAWIDARSYLPNRGNPKW